MMKKDRSITSFLLNSIYMKFQLQHWFEENKQTHPYPMYPNDGKTPRYEEIPSSNPEATSVNSSWSRRIHGI
ncbi:hypothetical protein J32TS6_22670 [Virgibacillus pantothenticus]|nr:hypothetical protein [Virgibacillus pantothenticus]MEB5450662.1 hypothetical protein [Virgibacillus pantothenticus]MEB5458605.1 hypothetical protein [Virgibacillus pantothenticus]MEB5464317.1 hypothetical protein [Virgibacillus pantothenticus]MED3736953.1 hypothetical protein [Virgibacillus pantothenticus]SIS72511.1 hypothetical protein SAMN05421787_102427 [Virgibacillus pantothenticus]